MGATDAVQDFFPFLHLPLDQKFRLPLLLGASHLPDGPFRFFAHGGPLPRKDKYVTILTEMNPEVYIDGNYAGNNIQIPSTPLY
jgi:hypothetical protein